MDRQPERVQPALPHEGAALALDRRDEILLRRREEGAGLFKKGKGRKTWSNVQVNMQFANGVMGHLTGSCDAGGGHGLETCELVGSEARVVIRATCEKLEFHQRHSQEVDVFEHLGGMGGFGDTFQSRIDAWISDLAKRTPPNKVDSRA